MARRRRERMSEGGTAKITGIPQRTISYCRVSTDQEEQLTSYEAQKEHYTQKIESNPNWTMVDIFADGGITGVMAKKRKEFLRMIEMCRAGKIDRILTKSISRFARNVS